MNVMPFDPILYILNISCAIWVLNAKLLFAIEVTNGIYIYFICTFLWPDACYLIAKVAFCMYLTL